MREKTAFFTGHRSIANNVVSSLESATIQKIIELINIGVIYYGNGGAYGFDILSAQCILKLKTQYPQIKLIMILPCKNQTIYWRASDICTYDMVLSRADKIVYLSQDYSERCMLDRNDYMIKNSKYCIAYLERNYGGTAYAVRKAKEKGLTICNVLINQNILE